MSQNIFDVAVGFRKTPCSTQLALRCAGLFGALHNGSGKARLERFFCTLDASVFWSDVGHQQSVKRVLLGGSKVHINIPGYQGWMLKF